jgi:hypothetical protein
VAKVTSGGYVFGVSLAGQPALVTTVSIAGEEQDAPPGRKFVVATVIVTDETGQREPLGLGLDGRGHLSQIVFAVPRADQAKFGEVSASRPGDCLETFSTSLPTGDCALTASSASLSPGGSGPGPIEMAPGDSQQAVIVFGPVPASAPLADATVYAVADSGPAVRVS